MFKIRYYYNPIIENNDGTFFAFIYVTNGYKLRKSVMYDHDYKNLLSRVQIYVDKKNREINSSFFNKLNSLIEFNKYKI